MRLLFISSYSIPLGLQQDMRKRTGESVPKSAQCIDGVNEESVIDENTFQHAYYLQKKVLTYKHIVVKP